MIFQLSEHEFNLINQVFQKFPNILIVKIYGSRALGCANHHSDIDFAVFGDIDFSTLALLSAELDELPLPYFFDLTIYNQIELDNLKHHIDQHGQIFYQK